MEVTEIRRIPRTRRLSTYLTIAGFIPGRFGACVHLFFGAASFGVWWQRWCDCVIGGGRREDLDPKFMLTHFPFFFIGLGRLWRSR